MQFALLRSFFENVLLRTVDFHTNSWPQAFTKRFFLSSFLSREKERKKERRDCKWFKNKWPTWSLARLLGISAARKGNQVGFCVRLVMSDSRWLKAQDTSSRRHFALLWNVRSVVSLPDYSHRMKMEYHKILLAFGRNTLMIIEQFWVFQPYFQIDPKSIYCIKNYHNILWLSLFRDLNSVHPGEHGRHRGRADHRNEIKQEAKTCMESDEEAGMKRIITYGTFDLLH